MARVVTLDAFIARHEAEWRRLAALARQRRLAPEETTELVARYERVATHAAIARSRYGDRELAARLAQLTAAAAAAVYGARPRRWSALQVFATRTFPAALWHLRWQVALAAVVFLVPALALGAWVATSAEAFQALGTEEFRTAYIEDDFASYYTDRPSTEFFALVTTNNVQVGVLAFALGILAVLPTLAVLTVNGLSVGIAGGLLGAAGDLGTFFALILPHGLLELTAVFIAGAAGIRLGWSWLAPGERRRVDALVCEARRAVVVVIGLFVVFAVAGLIEGYVTGEDWAPTWLQLGLGSAALAGFLGYAGVLGRRAAAAGLTGDLGEERAAQGVRALARVAADE